MTRCMTRLVRRVIQVRQEQSYSMRRLACEGAQKEEGVLAGVHHVGCLLHFVDARPTDCNDGKGGKDIDEEANILE